MKSFSFHSLLLACGSAAGRALRSSTWWCGVGSLLLTSCNLPAPQADTVRYFTLNGPTAAVPVANGTKVRPVLVAGHLHGRLLAVRASAHEIVYLDDFRWAEPLDESITALLRAKLSSVAGGATVTVQIDRCELVRAEGNSVQLAATYAIVPQDGDKNSPQRGTFTSSPRTWDGKDYGALVGQMGDAVAELGDAIAAALTTAK